MTAWAEQRSVPVTETGCWIWTGAEKGNGYGNVRKKDRNTTAHRESFVRANGPIPAHVDVCHKCDTRLCINPDHLFAGTRLENMRDCVGKGRQAKGSSLPQTKLNPEMVKEARRRREGGATITDIAASYGVSRMTISKAINLKTWKHI